MTFTEYLWFTIIKNFMNCQNQALNRLLDLVKRKFCWLEAKIDAPAHVCVAMVPVVMDCAISRGVIQTSRLNSKKNLTFDIF